MELKSNEPWVAAGGLGWWTAATTSSGSSETGGADGEESEEEGKEFHDWKGMCVLMPIHPFILFRGGSVPAVGGGKPSLWAADRRFH